MIKRLSIRRSEGETLIELLMAVVILGIGAMGLIAALSTNVVATEGHRRLSDSEKVTRAFGELVKDQVLHPATTNLTADTVPYANGDTVVLNVVSTAAFTDPAPYYIAVDNIVMQVTSQTATSFTAKALGGGADSGPWTDKDGVSHPGAQVQRYEPCPMPYSQGGFAPPGYWDAISQSAQFAPPTVGSGIARPYVTAVAFYGDGNTLVTSTTSTDGKTTRLNAYQACLKWHSQTTDPTPCVKTNDWRTDCDPLWLRATVSVAATDAGKATGTSTTTDILIRRVP